MIAMMILWGCAAWAGVFEEGKAAYNVGDFEIAHQKLTSAAAQGNAEAQTLLGDMFSEGSESLIGKGRMKIDHDEALRWYKMAAAQGHLRALFNLCIGARYILFGNNFLEVRWCQLGAEKGDAKAQNVLGEIYEGGVNVLQNYAEAMKWYGMAAAQGDDSAQRNRGDMYANGHGVTKNFVLAHMWYNLSTIKEWRITLPRN